MMQRLHFHLKIVAEIKPKMFPSPTSSPLRKSLSQNVLHFIFYLDTSLLPTRSVCSCSTYIDLGSWDGGLGLHGGLQLLHASGQLVFQKFYLLGTANHIILSNTETKMSVSDDKTGVIQP
jgi:hypothetical protein